MIASITYEEYGTKITDHMYDPEDPLSELKLIYTSPQVIIITLTNFTKFQFSCQFMSYELAPADHSFFERFSLVCIGSISDEKWS